MIKISLNPVILCCTMKNVYKNFIIGDKNVKKHKTPGTQARSREKRELVHKDEDVAEGACLFCRCIALSCGFSRDLRDGEME